jgi:hypothetical protein
VPWTSEDDEELETMMYRYPAFVIEREQEKFRREYTVISRAVTALTVGGLILMAAMAIRDLGR